MPVDFGLSPRKGSRVWQSHLPVPAELRHLYGGKRELRESLRTRDHTEAQRLARELCVQVFARFERQRRELNPAQVDTLTPAMLAGLVAAIRHDILAADDALRFDPAGVLDLLRAFEEVAPPMRRYLNPGAVPEYLRTDTEWTARHMLSPAQVERLAQVHDLVGRTLAGTVAGGNLTAAAAMADAEARKHLGVTVSWDRPENRTALAACMRAMAGAWMDRGRRDRGDIVDTPEKPEPPRPPEKPKPAPRLRDVWAPWKASRPDLNPKYVRSVERALEAFEEVTGNPPLSELKAAHGDDLRSWLLDRYESPKTAADKLSAVKGLLDYAEHPRELIARNPWGRLKPIKYPKDGKGTPWTHDEIGRLFGSPIFTGYRLPTVEAAGMDAAYWVPLMALYSGARVSELCQLRLIDIALEDGPDGPGSVPVFRVARAKADGRTGTKETRAKTAGSVRLVPIHAELIRLGFLEYVEALRKGGAVQLFPMVKRYNDDTGEGAGSALSTWFGEYRLTVGVERENTGVHASRHTVRTALTVQAGALDKQAFAIGGWTAPGIRSAGNAIYLHPDCTPAVLAALVNCINYPGLNLPRVYTEPAWTPGTAPVVHKPRRPAATSAKP